MILSIQRHGCILTKLVSVTSNRLKPKTKELPAKSCKRQCVRDSSTTLLLSYKHRHILFAIRFVREKEIPTLLICRQVDFCGISPVTLSDLKVWTGSAASGTLGSRIATLWSIIHQPGSVCLCEECRCLLKADGF